MKNLLVLAIYVQGGLGFIHSQSASSHMNLRYITTTPMSANDEMDGFWESQKKLAASMSANLDQEEKKIKA